MMTAGTHVFGLADAERMHVSDPVHLMATGTTLRYTLAGSPDGEPATGRSAACG